MDRNWLLKKVSEDWCGIRREIVESVVRLYCRYNQHPYDETDREEAGKWAKLVFLQRREWDQLAEALFASSPYLEIQSDQLRDAVLPWVEDSRREIEALADAGLTLPLASYSDAVKWLQTTARNEGVGVDSAQPKLGTNETLGSALQEELERRTGEGWPRALNVPYLDQKSDSVQRVIAQPGGALELLAKAVAKISMISGFSAVHVVGFILADVPPLLEPATVSSIKRPVVGPEGLIWPRQVTITLRTPYLTFEQLRQLYRVVRGAWNGQRKKPATEGDLKLYWMVKDRGGAPSEYGKVRSWWEDAARELGLKSGDAARVRWARLETKLAELNELPPMTP
jgi:hypothetical protein